MRHLGHVLAETARFELAVAVTRHDGLANRWFQPLTHVSGWQQATAYSDGPRRNQPPVPITPNQRPDAKSTHVTA